MDDTCTSTPTTTGGREQRAGRIEWPRHRDLRLRAALWAAVGAVALVLVYVVTLALANSLDHALTEFARLWYWMVPLVVGFAVQVGLFAYARRATHQEKGPHARGVVASGSASTLSMVACCAHHLTDVLPLVGLAGAAVFLSTYQSLFLLVGVLSNAVGLVYMLGLLSKHGLFPKQPSVLSGVLRWHVEKAFPYVLGGAVVVLVAAIAVEVL